MKQLSALLFVFLMILFCTAALADDVCEIDLDHVSGTVTTDCAYIRLTAEIPVRSAVSVEVQNKNSKLIYQHTYHDVSGSFHSEDIYLKQAGKATDYKIVLRTDTTTLTANVKRLLPSLSGADACAVGWPLPNDDHRSMTMIDVEHTEGRSVTAAINASDSFKVGKAVFSVCGGTLTVTVEPSNGVKLERCTVYVALNAVQAESFGSRSNGCITGSLNQAIDLQGASIVAVYLKANVSFDPNQMPKAADTKVKGQKALWNRMKEGKQE